LKEAYKENYLIFSQTNKPALKRTLTFIFVLTISCIAIAQNTPKLVIDKCATPPKIDGIADENDPWTDDWIPQNKPNANNKTSDISAQFQFSYDNDNFYLICQVSGDVSLDTASETTPNTWENDCVEVYIKLDTNSWASEGQYIPGDFHFRMRRASVFPDRFDIEQSLIGWQGYLKIGQVNNANGETQEWQIPWRPLISDMDPIWDGKYIKFDILTSDNTTGKNGGRTQLIFWNSNSDEQWRNTQYLGLIQLEKPIGILIDTSFCKYNIPLLKEPFPICMVTVDESQKNIVIWQRPDNELIDSIVIFRESFSQTDVFELIGKVSNSAQSVFTDENSNALIQSNRYAISSQDICGFITPLSLSHKTMHLAINKGQSNSWNLIWEPYEGFSVKSYKIYRGTTRSNMTVIGSTAGGGSSYTDFTAPEGDIFYQVEVLAPYSCSTKKSTTYSSSRSNIASNTAISVPSALSVNSLGIYPVPVRDVLYFSNNINELVDANIYTSDGRLVLLLKQITTNQKIDVSKLSKGIYLLQLNCSKGNYIEKFIKE
jgi:hypothetical protein